MPRPTLLLGVWMMTLVACGSTTEPPPPAQEKCSPSNCSGCCTPEGRCSRGLEVSECGAGGMACTSCSSQERCTLDGQCTRIGPPDGGPPEPPCGATALTLVEGKAQVSGTTVNAERRAVGSCGGIDGSEVFFSFTLPQSISTSTDVVITVTPRDAAFQPVVYLRQDTCDSAGSEMYKACVAAHDPGATVLLHTRLSPSSNRTYYLVVDGLSDPSGAFDLSVEVGGRAGDGCADVLPLPGQRFTVRSTYSYAGDAFTPGCSQSGGSDRVYQLVMTEPAYFSARVEEDASAFHPSVVAVADLCGGREQVCTSRPDSVLLSAGTHYLWLDRYLFTNSDSSYVLRGQLSAPLPGDSCSRARPLLFSSGAQGGTASDTVPAEGQHEDGNWACGGMNGTDLVYSFTTDRTLVFQGRATDSAGQSLPLTVVRAACDQSSIVACSTSTLDIAELTAGSYFLWVDGLSASTGTVSLSASLTPP